MKSKWYLSTLVLILALLGFSQQHITVPNQEIVVQFDDDEVTIDQAQNAIAIVKQQLLSIGVENIHVRESANGSLKITYYSEIDVTGIEKIFSKEKNLGLGYISFDQEQQDSEFPSENDTNNYKLNVSEIQSSYDDASDFTGLLLERAQKIERPYNPIVYFSVVTLAASERISVEKVSYRLQKSIAITIDNSSHNIPEVRAGPVA